MSALPPDKTSSAASAASQSAGCLTALGLSLLTITVVVPAGLVGILTSLGALASVGGRMLNNAQAMSHGQFDSGFEFATGAIIPITCVFGARAFAKQTTTPFTNSWFWAPLGGAVVTAVPTWLWQLLSNRVDDDWGFAFAATCLLIAGSLGAAVVAIRTIRLGLKAVWSLASSSPNLAGFVAGASLVAGLGAGLVEYLAVPEAVAELAKQSAVLPAGQQFDASTQPRASETALVIMARSASVNVIRSGQSTSNIAAPQLPRDPAYARLAPPGGAMERCASELGADCSKRPCAIEQVRASLQRYLQRADADIISNVALFEACLRATETDTLDQWRAALFARAKWRRDDLQRWQRRTCSMLETLRAERRQVLTVEDELEDGAVFDALCLLRDVDQCVLNRRLVDDLPFEAVATICGLPSAAAARQQFGRAAERLKEKMMAVRRSSDSAQK